MVVNVVRILVLRFEVGGRFDEIVRRTSTPLSQMSRVRGVTSQDTCHQRKRRHMPGIPECIKH